MFCKLSNANSKSALQEVYDVTSIQMTKQPNGIFGLEGDEIKHTFLEPKFHQHV